VEQTILANAVVCSRVRELQDGLSAGTIALEIASRNARVAALQTLGPPARRPRPDPRSMGRRHGRRVRHGSAPTVQAPHQYHVDFPAAAVSRNFSRSCRCAAPLPTYAVRDMADLPGGATELLVTTVARKPPFPDAVKT
jgi:hypothetical protein